MSIGKKREIEHAICMENRAIWPKTVGRGREKKEE